MTLPGAFAEQVVRMQPFGHDTRSPSIGKGGIREVSDEAILKGLLNLNMQAGRALNSGGKLYLSLSAAGKAITGHAVNGWRFWQPVEDATS